MSSYKCTFSFKSQEMIEYKLDEKILVRLERIGFGVARLYFVKDNAEIDIPRGIEVMDETNKVKVLPFINEKYFLLGWTDNYSVKMNGEQILGLTNKRQWSVTGKPSTPFHIIET